MGQESERGGPLARLWDVVLRPLRAARRLRRPQRLDRRGPGEASPSPGSAGLFGPSRVDRYLSAAFLKMLVAVFVVLFTLHFVIDLRRAITSVDDSYTAFPWRDVFAYAALSLPGALPLLTPIAILAAAGIALSALARSGEIVAMKAAGIGPARIALPVLGSTLILCLLLGAAQETLMPAAERESRRTLDKLRNRVTADLADSGRRWIVGQDGHLWAYLDWDQRREALLAPGLIEVDLERARIAQRIEAGEATYEGGRWAFEAGWRRVFPVEGFSRFERFSETKAVLAEDPALFGANRDRLLFGRRLVDQLTIKELWRHLDRLGAAGFDAAPLVVGLYQKFVMPFLAFCLVMVGVPLIVSGWSRKGSLYGFGIALLVTFGFWGIWAVTTSLGRNGVLSPPLASFAAPALLIVIGAVLLARAR